MFRTDRATGPGPGRKVRHRTLLSAIARLCHSRGMVAHDTFFTLISGIALALVGFGFARSRAILAVRFVGLLAMLYGVYIVLTVTHMIG